MKLPMSAVCGIAIIAMMLVAAYAIPKVGDPYWNADTPILTSDDGSIVCSRASYRDYLKVSMLVGDLGLGLSPIPKSFEEKQRIIDSLAAIGPDGDETQIFSSHIATGDVFRTQCVGETCTLVEMGASTRACEIAHWNDCIPSLVRYKGHNYCLLEVTENHE